MILIIVLIVEKRKKDSRKTNRIYDEVAAHKEKSSQISSSTLDEIYENVHGNPEFVKELNTVIGKGLPVVENGTATQPSQSEVINENTNIQGKVSAIYPQDNLGTNNNARESCQQDQAFDNVEKTEDEYTLIHTETIYTNTGSVNPDFYQGQDDNISGHENQYTKHSPPIDLEKAQQIYENAAFPVKCSRIATPRICEKSRQGSKKGKPPIGKKGSEETVQPILQKLERPRILLRRNSSVISETDLIYDDVPDEKLELDYNRATDVKPAIRPKPRLSKILRNKSKTPSPTNLRTVDDTIMIDNDIYTNQ